MVTIGQALTAPEAGWRRYEVVDNDTFILLPSGSWDKEDSSVYSGGSAYYTPNNNVGAIIMFKFKGTKLRLISYGFYSYPTDCRACIDGVVSNFSCAYNTKYQALVLDINNLENKVHIVQMIQGTNGSYQRLYADAIDIDENGYILKYNDNPPNPVNIDISQLSVGDRIPCRYIASISGRVGVFSELGTCITDEIPITGTTTPNGLFYFIKVDKGLLIADRVVQTGISWDVLNTSGYIQGKITSFVPMIGTAMCDSVYTGRPSAIPDNALFGSPPNAPYPYWISNVATSKSNDTSWIGIKFSVAKCIKTIMMTQYSNFADATNVMNVDYSNDGLNWNTLQRVNTDFNSGIYMVNDTNIAALYWRVSCSKAIGSNMSAEWLVYSLKFLEFNCLVKIRSLTGGNAYLGTDGKASLTYKGSGAWPTNNEYDTYILNSNLEGKIIAGDSSVWNKQVCWCQDTPVVTVGKSSNRVYRLDAFYNLASTNSQIGFRPVLEYPEDARCTNIWY
jgi:hypothetical protein